MAALVGRRVRTTQPQQAPQIDWSNPITAGLVFAYTMGNEAMGWGEDGRSVVQYQRSDGTVNGVPVNTNSGTAVRCLTGSGVGYACSLNQTSAKAGSYSLFAFATGSAAGAMSALDDDDGSARRFQFRVNANKVELIPFYSGGNGSVIAASFLNAYDAANGFAMGATVNGTSYACYQKGVKASATLGGVALAPNSTISVGARKSTVQQWTSGGIQLVAMWNRPLTDAEHQSLADNPWQLFKGPARRIWMPRAPLGAYVLQATAAVFGLTGAAALMTATRRLVAGAGSFGVAGVPASLRVARRLPASPASFALTGAAAAIRAARRLPAQAGAFALSGSAAQMVYTPAQGPVGPTYVLGASAGAFGLAGNSARLSIARRLRAALGAFALTGAAARVQAARRLRADAGGFAIAGSAAVLKYSSSAGRIDVSQIPAARLVVFDGSGSRISPFDGSGSRVAVFGGSGARTNLNGVNVKLPTLVGTKMTVDRDPDEISYYGADITQELFDRATTAKSVELVLVGVVQKAPPDIQVVPGDAGSRTYVVAFLAGTDSEPPDGWKWVARVTCANGERFDKTTWFNKVDP